eukprot:7702036-Ditylum_brightwellii.AAC.1
MIYGKGDEKGETICFHAGTYNGKTAINSINLELQQTSAKPKTYAEALMKQKPEVEKLMKMLSRQ